jgi:ABC-type branched-subunit amino acid transport system ATPase component
LLVLSAGLAHLKRSGFGRTMIAARDNPRSAEAMTIWPAAVKLSTFCLSGAIAAFAGGLLAGLLGSYTASAFLPGQSMTLLAMAVVGGIAYASGAALSAAAFIALPAIVGPTVNGWFGNNQGLLLLITGVGLIAILIQEPRGIAGRLALAREHFVRRQLARIRPGDEPELAPRSQDIVALAAEWADTAPGDERPLETHDVRVAFGGLIANAGVSIHADKGEIVGLIGNNGAGKTTLMNVISGFVKPVAGEVRLFGEDVTRMPPYQRAEFGVARVFQDARLFEGLTVRETIATALEFDQPSNMTGALLCLPGTLDAEFDKIERVEEVLAALNLEKYADSLTSTLSIGTRRVVEIACTIVASPRLILLDEPTAGIAQREAEAFGPIIRHLRDALGATIIIIEHDIPLLMSICDRVYAMGAGAVIAEGDPETVRSNPQVIAAYLGSDERSLQRSLHVTPATS